MDKNVVVMGKLIQVYYIFQFVMEILTFEIFNLFYSGMSIYPMSVIHYEMSDNFHFWSFSIPEKIMSLFWVNDISYYVLHLHCTQLFNIKFKHINSN